MKLIVQIPCFNEEQTLPQTLADIPREIPGIDAVELLIIDDGSTDATVTTARELGVEHIVRFPGNRGLASAFKAGLDASLGLGADIIVNTDGDNQYCGHDIPALVRPILDGEADLVVGDRRTDTIEHFGLIKKKLQKLGSAVVRGFSHTTVADATSGFRAFSREAALRLNLVSEFTYTLETIIQAGHNRMAVQSVPIRTNPKTRPSRLFRGIGQYVRRSVGTILRIFMMYRPLAAFVWIGGLVFAGGFALGVRFLYYYFAVSGAGHVQSLVLAAALLMIGVQVMVMGLLADLIGANRKLVEDVLVRVKRLEASRPDDG
jgi:glycosyltransferase involved in cell wall biosynthesis